MLDKLLAAHAGGKLQFFGKHAALTERKAFAVYLGHCAGASGTSTQSLHSADPRQCSPICRAILIASPSPTAG